ncbi:MAG TPA: S1/P1 Nuclease, partial [Thermoanaerobaculia bacterium]|nr:S1/P1 Nuclease [Thermoanaerobaculia bacterium]
MSDFFTAEPRFNSLSLLDLLRARDQFHAHLLHKANVVGTAIGRYLIRKSDPYPKPGGPQQETAVKRTPPKPKPARTLESSEVRDYSWPAILVFVSEWAQDADFGVGVQQDHPPSDYIPKTIYLEDGQAVPVCVVLAPRVTEAPPPLDSVRFPDRQISGGYPVIASVQGGEHIASLGCLVTDGHKLFAITSAHVAGEPGEKLATRRRDKLTPLGVTAGKRLTKLPFEKVYESWPGRHIWVNVDVGLIEIEDQKGWSPSVFGIGTLGPLADLSVENLSLNLIGCPVRAYGCGGGAMHGRIAALFYRYRSVGGFEYVADFLIGSRDARPLTTRPGDSGAVWVIDSDVVAYDRSPIAIQWGGTVFDSGPTGLPFALATNLSTVCRELDLEIVRSTRYASFDYWGAVGHYTIGALACDQVGDANLRTLLHANRIRISFAPETIGVDVNDVTVPGYVPLADVPDKVWKKTKSTAAPYGRRGPENPNHYADMDFPNPAGKTLDDITQQSGDLDVDVWIDYYRSVGWNKVSQRGLAPFRIWQIYKAMVEYVTHQDVARYVAAAGVLAHYVGDLAQPLHSSYLTDGDPFKNPDGSP